SGSNRAGGPSRYLAFNRSFFGNAVSPSRSKAQSIGVRWRTRPLRSFVLGPQEVPMSTRSRRVEIRAMDPECGKAVDPENSIQLRWEGKTYYFCSEACKAQFEMDPPGDAGF